jgi:hypothetical protein
VLKRRETVTSKGKIACVGGHNKPLTERTQVRNAGAKLPARLETRIKELLYIASQHVISVRA